MKRLSNACPMMILTPFSNSLVSAKVGSSQFVRESVVDVPAHLEDLIAQAEADDWNPWAAATVLTRPSWWVWQATAIADWNTFVSAAARGREDATPVWQHAAMIGISRTYTDPNVGATMLAILAVIGRGEGLNVEDSVQGLEQARKVAKSAGLPILLCMSLWQRSR